MVAGEIQKSNKPCRGRIAPKPMSDELFRHLVRKLLIFLLFSRDAIRRIIDVFLQTWVLRRTVKELLKAGVKVPSRDPAYPGMFMGKQYLNPQVRR